MPQRGEKQRERENGGVVGQTFCRPKEKRNVSNRKEGKNPIHLRLFFFFVFYCAVPRARPMNLSVSSCFFFYSFILSILFPHLSVKLWTRGNMEDGKETEENPGEEKSVPHQTRHIIETSSSPPFLLPLMPWTLTHKYTKILEKFISTWKERKEEKKNRENEWKNCVW